MINYFLDIICVAYSPIGAPNRPDFFKEASHPVLLEDDVIKAISKKHNATAAQVYLRSHQPKDFSYCKSSHFSFFFVFHFHKLYTQNNPSA